MRNAVGIFGGLAGVIVVALVGRYGFATSDTRLDGAIAAFFFAVIAVGGIGGPAVAVHLFRTSEGWGKLWGVTAGAIAAIALLANLSNSLGAIAGRADKTLAERAQVTEARKDDRAELARLMREREAMPAFVRTDAAAVQAAKRTADAATRARKAECGDGDPKQRGRNCRAYEATENEANNKLAEMTAAKAATDQAAALDSKADAIRTRLGKAAPVAAVNPMAETLARIFPMQADDAATWQQVATVIVVELLIAFALIAFELLGTARHTAPTGPVELREQPAAEKMQATSAELTSLDASSASALTRRSAVEPAAVAAPARRQRSQRKSVALALADRAPGDVAKFAVACLRPAVGSSIAIPALYQPYSRWCEQHGFCAVSPRKFEELFATLCDLSGFALSAEAGEACCLNLELAA